MVMMMVVVVVVVVVVVLLLIVPLSNSKIHTYMTKSQHENYLPLFRLVWRSDRSGTIFDWVAIALVLVCLSTENVDLHR